MGQQLLKPGGPPGPRQNHFCGSCHHALVTACAPTYPVSCFLCLLSSADELKLRCTVLQGPTSSGKTSLVAYLAAQTGHEFVRINNHQGTDLQVCCFSSFAPHGRSYILALPAACKSHFAV